MRWETQLRSRRSIPALILYESQTGRAVFYFEHKSLRADDHARCSGMGIQLAVFI
ncbi:hypothetical protein ACPR111641_02280 [Acinetobacter pragensis]